MIFFKEEENILCGGASELSRKLSEVQMSRPYGMH
jgi:hypothetical protein